VLKDEMATIQCDIVSAQEEIFSGKASMVFATGVVGELGISPRHAPLITQLKPGPIRVQKPDGEEEFYFVGGGILEVQPHIITVLADTAVRGADLDEVAAKRAMEEAERELADRTGELEVAEAQAKLSEAIAQLQALEQFRKKLKR
jgi:F-type H+-transporting ATPase subunit epsilon